jgi:gliding motility-associated-like protein
VTNIEKIAGEFVASKDCANSGTYTNTWTVTDACSNTSDVFTQVITIQDTTAPTWTTEIASLDQTIECSNIEALSTAQALFPEATDTCDSDVTNIEKIAGEFVASKDCSNSGTYTNTWTVTDACGKTSEVFTQVITIQDTTAPTWTTETASLDQTIECSDTAALDSAQALFPEATDTCDSDVSNIEKSAGQFIASEDCANSGTYTNTWTVTDACGKTSEVFTQVITIQDTTAPITTTEFNTSVNVNCDAIPLKPELVFVDNCSALLTPTYTETISESTPNSYLLDRKWVVSDACGNTSTFNQIVNVSVTNGGATIASKACDTDTATIDLNSLLPTGTPAGGKWFAAETERPNIFDPLNVAAGDYVFEYKISEGDCKLSILLTMTVETDCGGVVLGCGSVLVHNAFSPNGDAKNTKFVIENIDDRLCYPENTVEIYNRWGVLVYETKNYNNSSNYFDGTSEGRSTVTQSNGLPAGTYYYILSYTSFDNNGVIQTNEQDGYLYLTR